MLANRWFKKICALLAIFCATPVSAECIATLTGGCLSVPFGWYLEFNIGQSKLTDVKHVSDNKGWGGNIDLGYKFMPYFGLEFGYTQYANTSIKLEDGTKSDTIKHNAFDIAARGILPYGSFEAFTKLGISRLFAKISDHHYHDGHHDNNTTGKTALYIAIGGQYYFSPESAIILQWARANGNKKTGTEELWSIGVSYLYDW